MDPNILQAGSKLIKPLSCQEWNILQGPLRKWSKKIVEKDTGDSTAKHDRGKKNGLGSHSKDFKLEPNQDTFPSLKEKEPGNICP